MTENTTLLEKRRNLINVNKKTKEVFLNKDFTDLSLFFTNEELFNFFSKTENDTLVFNRIDYANKVTNLIKNASTIDDINTAFSTLGLKAFNTVFPTREWNNSFIQKEQIIELLVKRKKDDFKKLFQELSEVKIEYYDSSIWKFYASFGMLQGKFHFPNTEDSIVSAPLINIQIEIVQSNNDIIFRKLSEEVNANEILEMIIDDQFSKHSKLTEEIEKDDFEPNKYLNYVASLFESATVDDKYSTFEKFNKEDFISSNSEKITIKKCFIISYINPVGGKMLQDYDDVLSQNYEFPVCATMFHENVNDVVYNRDEIYQLNHPSNLIAKLAVANSYDKNVLVYGPPGTGKSDAVGNIICNCITKNKSVIAISEKKAALDVIDGRIGALSSLSMSAYDDKNTDVFYQKILTMNELILKSEHSEISPILNEYLELIQYQTKLNELINYKTISGRNIFKHMIGSKNIDISFYRHNEKIFEFIYNHIAQSNETLSQFITKIKTLGNVRELYLSNFNKSDIKNSAYNWSDVSEFLEVFKDISDIDDQKFAIKKFIVEKVIVKKKGLFKHLQKSEADIDVYKYEQTFKDIVNQKITYILNSEEIYDMIKEGIDIELYVTYFDWNINSNLPNYIKTLDEIGNCQQLISKYWNRQTQATKNSDIDIRNYFLSQLHNKIEKDHSIEIKWIELVRKANLPKRPNVNKIIKTYYDLLKQIFPVWVLAPDAVASILPLNPGEFDVGIFDEASQMRLERSIPLIYRCKTSVISGDDKQLKPSSFFSKTVEIESEDDNLDNVDSLLDKAKTSNWMSFTLSNHYRSLNEQLIHFSDHFFYDDKLLCITKNGNFQRAIECYDLNAIYDRENNINQPEAEKAIECTIEAFSKYKSVIIITFNQKQADYVQNLALGNSLLNAKLENLLLKVRSLENVQGDESEVVIITTTFGKDSEGKFIQNFGPVNQDGGKNRINVMASRAKCKMIIIKSISSEWITNVHNENTLIFKNFIAYAEEVAKNGDVGASNKEISQTKLISLETDDIYDEIKKHLSDIPNIIIEKNKKIGTHIINISISKQNSEKISLFILIDGEYELQKYAADIHKWIISVDKQKYFTDRGYPTYRINYLEWLFKKDTIISHIKSSIE